MPNFALPTVFRRGRTLAALTGVLGLAGLLALGTTPAYSDFSARVSNTNGKVGTGTAFATIKNSGGTTLCSSQPGGASITNTNTWLCTGSATPASIGSSVQNVPLTLTNGGNTAFASAQAGTSGCGLRALVNSRTTANVMLPRYGTTTNQGGPFSGASSLQVNGSNALATSTTLQSNPQTFTIAAWFKTGVPQGAIMGFGNNPGMSLGAYDRILYVDKNGNVAWDVVPGGGAGNIKTVRTSGTNYANGAWHMVVGVASAAPGNSSITLYVDNVQIGTQSYTSDISAEAYDGYWRLGHTPLDARTDAASPYFGGYISNAATFPTALTASQVNTLYGATTQANYNSTVTSLGATNHWQLSTESTFTGTRPAGTADPCSHVGVYANDTLAGVMSTSPVGSVPPVAPGTPQTLNLGLATTADYADFDAGLHLIYAAGVKEINFTQTFAWLNQVSIMR